MRLRRNPLWWLKVCLGVLMFLAGLYLMARHSLPHHRPTKRNEEHPPPPPPPQQPLPLLTHNRNAALDQHAAHVNLKSHVPVHVSEETKDWNDYALQVAEARQTGPGEQGQAYFLPSHLSAEKDQLYRVNGFNARASDDIALNRSLQDLRHSKCRDKRYLGQLPRASVVVPFHNEHWSTLLRTAVSAINRSPESLLLEVILVDDASTKGFLKAKLDEYVRANLPKVRVLHLAQRSGLIRARLAGARAARGEVLIFLDSHTECTTNWLPPLLDPIAKDYRTCVCPFIDVIDYETFAYRAQDEGARGAFDWELFYKRLPLLPEDKKNMPEPFKSPVMAGGLFAISTKFFWELGGYDPGLDIWGGEQYELSFKPGSLVDVDYFLGVASQIWQCGGTMVDSPCSRIGHIYRKFAPFPNPGVGNFVGRNYRRVAEVWMDEYAEYLYKRRPSYRSIDPGDLTQQRAIRTQLKCRSFSWFMKEVAFDLTKVYPPVEPPDYASGKIESVASGGLCIDTRYKHHGDRFGLEECGWGGEQNMHLTWHQDIRPGRRSICWDVSSGDPRAPVLLYNCHGMGGNQLWKYDPTQQWLVHGGNPRCLDSNPGNKEVFVSACDPTKVTQRWKFEKFDINHLKEFDKNALHI